jgi:3-oxoadipate enol-lactonase
MPFAVNDGTRIYWEEHGEGDPVLLIMGLGYTHDMWYRTIPPLARRYRVIAFDNRGVGQTDAPAGPYLMTTMAADAAAVIKAAGCNRAHVFGISLGGMVAQELALTQPELVRSLILGCTLCGGPNSIGAGPEVLAALQARATMTPEEGVLAMAPYIYDDSTPRERLEEDFVIRRRTFPKPEAYLAQLGGVMFHDTYSRLPGLRTPSLVIHGENDKLVPPQNGELLARLIPGARLVMLPNASHVFITDQPAASMEAILSFLDAV